MTNIRSPFPTGIIGSSLCNLLRHNKFYQDIIKCAAQARVPSPEG